MTCPYDYINMYSDILDSVASGALLREEIIAYVMKRAKLCKRDEDDISADGIRQTLRARCGALINEMLKKGVLAEGRDGRYFARTEKPVALRAERCEAEILRILSAAPTSKDKLKRQLITFFGTDKTETRRDDNMLSSFIAQRLSELTRDGVISYNGTVYSIPPAKCAFANDRYELTRLKADFLSVLHSRGGEFFEYYFMNLLGKYLTLCGKTVTECNVTGGAADGGVDGIAKTVDELGFRETVIVQTKNRSGYTTELDVRGFYGAVYASRGTRGIYATTSGFHPTAVKLLDSLDDCIGIDGEKIFEMARKTGYGIKGSGEGLFIDTEVI